MMLSNDGRYQHVWEMEKCEMVKYSKNTEN